MIGNLQMAIGTLTSHLSWAWCKKSVRERREVRFFSDCVQTDLDYVRGAFCSDLIVNEFKQIGLI